MRKELTYEAVVSMCDYIIFVEGRVVTTLEVKERLRNAGFEARQREISDLVDSWARDSQGRVVAHRCYSLAQ